MVEEAETLLCEADSLRVKGIAPTDSTLWAETVASLTPWRYFYPTDYVKANYYYGRLLRAKGSYPEAMQCFIDATHSRSKDYMWIGKAWTNIGDFCRSDGNYDLAYDVHVRAAEAFKRDNNMRAYYYELNNMAVVRAFQKDRNAVQEILSTIEQECTDSAVLTKILETRAFLYGNVRVFDSVMYFVNAVLSKGFPVATCYVEKAQAFWWMNQYDSALYYAQIALSHHCSLREKVDMLYITSHNDPTIDSDSILAITSERADLQRILTDQKSQLSHAVEILQQSMKPNYKWLYGIVVTVIVIGLILLIILLSTKKRRNLAQRHIEQQVQNIAQQYIQNCTNLSHLTTVQFANTVNWKNFDDMCKYINAALNNFADNLQQQYPSLTERELRLCILVLMNFSYDQIAELMNYGKEGVGKFKYLTAQKIGSSVRNLHEKLFQIMCKK